METFENSDLKAKIKADLGVDAGDRDWCADCVTPPCAQPAQLLLPTRVASPASFACGFGARDAGCCHAHRRLPFKGLEQSVRTDVQIVKNSPLIPNNIPVCTLIHQRQPIFETSPALTSLEASPALEVCWIRLQSSCVKLVALIGFLIDAGQVYGYYYDVKSGKLVPVE